MYYSNLTNKKQYLKDCTHHSFRWRLVDAKGKPTIKTSAKKFYYKRFCQVPCARQRCEEVVCRQFWARNEAAILMKSFEVLPPTHFIVLEAPFLQPSHVWDAWRKFRRKVKDRCPFEYTLFIEVGTNGVPHIHFLARYEGKENLEKVMRKSWYELIIPKYQLNDETSRVRYYCQPVRNAVNSAKYLPKFWHCYDEDRAREYGRKLAYRQVVPWLPGKEWSDIDLQMTSRKFLSMPRKDLWESVKRDWFDEEESFDGVEEWAPPQKPVRVFQPLDKVKCHYLPDGVECTVVGYVAGEDVYCVRVELTAEQLKALPEDTKKRLYKPFKNTNESRLFAPYYSLATQGQDTYEYEEEYHLELLFTKGVL